MVSRGKVEKLNLICCHFIVRLRQFAQLYSLDAVRKWENTEDLNIEI